jgi:DNA-nicking Smr family endonuclease
MKPAVYKGFKELRTLFPQEGFRYTPGYEKPFPERNSLPENLGDEELFLYSTKDVTPLGWSAVPLPPGRPVEIHNPQQSEDEGLRLLTEFVMGKGSVDLTLSGEYIEGAPHPDGRLLVHLLREGRFSVQSHIDLHGLNSEEARKRLDRFLRHSLMRGCGCVRIVHGRGHNSSNGQPVLKEQLQKWLNSRRISRHVIAYTSACLSDGGGGAVYVLLRRRLR